jgi:hypothetical protein
VNACPQPNYRPACALSLPALNSLFEVARLRAGAEKHPPQIIYLMLFGVGLGCSLLAGFGMAATAGHSWIHMVIFAGTLTVALLYRDRYGISASRPYSDREFRSFPRRRSRSNAPSDIGRANPNQRSLERRYHRRHPQSGGRHRAISAPALGVTGGVTDHGMKGTHALWSNFLTAQPLPT